MKTTILQYHPAFSAKALEFPDNGRRGMPLPGCDCVQCFGRCIIDHDAARRELSLLLEVDGKELE